jgi:hypothetical protein
MLAHLSLKMVEAESGKTATTWARERERELDCVDFVAVGGKRKNLLQTGSYTATTFST